MSIRIFRKNGQFEISVLFRHIFETNLYIHRSYTSFFPGNMTYYDIFATCFSSLRKELLLKTSRKYNDPIKYKTDVIVNTYA